MLNRSNRAAIWMVAVVGFLLATLVLSTALVPSGNTVVGHVVDADEVHGDEPGHVHYAEDRTDAVRNFASADPENAEILWSIRGVDAADFTIDSAGVLRFASQPDYENPTDRERAVADFNNDNDNDDPGEAAVTGDDNEYQVTVTATEVWDGNSQSLPAKRSDQDLTVHVENADDLGELVLNWRQPEVDVEITAELTDSDDTDDPGDNLSGQAWQWYRSKVAEPAVVGNLDHWSEIDDTANGSNTAAYTPQEADEGWYLWAHVEYRDATSPDTPITNDKEADAKSVNAVRAEVADNDNGSPDFGQETDTRTVSESLAVDANVGAAVTADDPDPEDILTYELDAAGDPNESDIGFFAIDRASGQITVAQQLDADAAREENTTAGVYVVIVSATDPSGVADNITITITAENANEAPIITGRAVLTVNEINSTDEDGTDTTDYEEFLTNDYQQFPDQTPSEAEYLVTEPDAAGDSIATWHLEGPDAGAFDLGGTFEPRYLNFKAAPDYENPTDANRDNVYDVTIVATDTDPLGTGAGVGRITVAVVVTNFEETGGVVFTEGETAFLNQELVAQVHDPDDHGGDMGEPYQGVHVQTWMWERADGDTRDSDGNIISFEEIPGETTNRYTPTEDDRGDFLRVTATYTDPHSGADDTSTDHDERVSTADPGDNLAVKTVSKVTDNAVRLAPGPASRPMFPDSVTRSVAENTGPGGNVGDPVAATGPESITYTLEGADKKYFNINESTGQITVGGDDPDTTDETEAGTDPKLDYDDPAKRGPFSVTVIATTGGGQTAQVAVTILVTDVNELPEVTDADGEAVARPAAVDYPEAKDGAPNTEPVATYAALDPEGLKVSWDVRGADAPFFTVNGGVLRFVNPPDYEDPQDIVGTNTVTPDAVAGDNVYSVMVRAITARASGDTGPAQVASFRVDVTVTDAEEAGAITLDRLQPEIGEQIRASLADPDADSPTVTWKWEVSEVADDLVNVDEDTHWGDPADATASTAAEFTPSVSTTDDTISDEGKFLRLTVTYSDGTASGQDDDATTDFNESTGDLVRVRTLYKVQAEDGGEANGSPDFVDEMVELSVAENIAVDATVGRVTASVQSASPTDTLTYSLRAFENDDIGSTGLTVPVAPLPLPADDLAAFVIDQATGQITVAQELDFESRGDPDDGKYIVVVEVVDPSGNDDSIVAVITAEDRNDNPVLDGRPELTIEENLTEIAGDFDGTDNYYTVTDQDRHAGISRWSLEGPDAGDMQLIGTVGRTLIFRTAPDFETPADADGDNVYNVTIVAIDNAGGRAEFKVCIVVTNANEVGEVTLLDANGDDLVQPHAHGEITADLSDPDGGVRGLTWEWEKSETEGGNFSAITETVDGESVAITTATYTPTNADRGFYLRATATYRDLLTPDTATELEVMETTDHSVLEGAAQGRHPPEFRANGSDVTSVSVSVAENSPSGSYVDAPLLAAMDPDGPNEALIYTIEDVTDGDDAKYFELVPRDDGDAATDDPNSRQLRLVGPLLRAGTGGDTGETEMYDPVDLDHEIDPNDEDDRNTYTIVLKASDGAKDDTLTVTIRVTNRNEAPSMPALATDPQTPSTNSAPQFATATVTRSVVQGTISDRSVGSPVFATDPDRDSLTYSLSGVDASSFRINPDSGQILTRAALDAGVKDTYNVTVNAVDGRGGVDTVDVTITVVAGGTGSAVIDQYAGSDGVIVKGEMIQAFRAYVAKQIDKTQIQEIFRFYVAQGG